MMIRRERYSTDLITEWRGIKRGNDLLTDLEIDQLINHEYTPPKPRKAKLSKKHKKILDEIERSLTQQ